MLDSMLEEGSSLITETIVVTSLGRGLCEEEGRLVVGKEG